MELVPPLLGRAQLGERTIRIRDPYIIVTTHNVQRFLLELEEIAVTLWKTRVHLQIVPLPLDQPFQSLKSTNK